MSVLDNLKRASEGKLIICFPGVGSAFAKKNSHTSMIVGKNGKLILVDCGTSTPAALHEKAISVTDFDGYYFTHSHSDHVGGVEEIFLKSRYVAKKKVSVLITENYQEELWENTLKGGCEYSDAGRLRFPDYAVPVRPRPVNYSPREMFKAEFHGINLTIFRTRHMSGEAAGDKAFWSTGLIIEKNVVFSGDTQFDHELFNHTAGYVAWRLSTIFHDCQLFEPGAVHATFNELSRLPEHLKERMYLMHYGDTWEAHTPQPQEAGFKGWVKPWEIYEFPVMPHYDV